MRFCSGLYFRDHNAGDGCRADRFVLKKESNSHSVFPSLQQNPVHLRTPYLNSERSVTGE
jgi:hypothetical protein